MFNFLAASWVGWTKSLRIASRGKNYNFDRLFIVMARLTDRLRLESKLHARFLQALTAHPVAMTPPPLYIAMLCSRADDVLCSAKLRCGNF